MAKRINIFLNKKILIYGLGKTGLSTYKFLKDKSKVFLFDDFFLRRNLFDNKKKIINYKSILKSNFDFIVLSPGIDINKCKLSKYLKKNRKKVFSDLDIFYSFYKNKCITITGTNGKSTTCQLLYEILLKHKFDVKLVGNIGNPILLVERVKKKTIFVVEASSYQLEYSQLFKSKFAAILNLSADHLERHKTLNNYVKSKFKLLSNQPKTGIFFVNKYDALTQKELNSKKFKSSIFKVDSKKIGSFLSTIDNNYFLTETNKENLSFVLEISKKLRLNNKLIKKSVQNFKGLKYRQQVIFKKKNLTVINDSKSTSFASSTGTLKVYPNIYWLLGGISKKNDKFILPKKYFKNIRAFIYGKNKRFFNKELKGKIKSENFNNLSDALKKIFSDLKIKKFQDQTVLFSPCAASFDSFKNFEDRGFYFNKLIKKYVNGI
jgi:UDP-N-acetylmuramoylalanine--D-glutamate ligase